MIREFLRKWLGLNEVDARASALAQICTNLENELCVVKDELAEFKRALKSKAQDVPKKALSYTDYESSQITALEQFREEQHGV